MEQAAITLREIALRASDLNGGARGRQLGRIASQHGLTLSYTTVDKIIAGTYTSRPSAKTLEALAKLSEVPLVEVYEAARVEMPQASLSEQLPPEVDTLNREQRRILIDLARVFVKQNKELYEAQSEGVGGNVSTAPNKRAGESPAKSNVASIGDYRREPIDDEFETEEFREDDHSRDSEEELEFLRRAEKMAAHRGDPNIKPDDLPNEP